MFYTLKTVRYGSNLLWEMAQMAWLLLMLVVMGNKALGALSVGMQHACTEEELHNKASKSWEQSWEQSVKGYECGTLQTN